MKLVLTSGMMKESGATEAPRVSPSPSTLSQWLMESGHETWRGTGGLTQSALAGRIFGFNSFLLSIRVNYK